MDPDPPALGRKKAAPGCAWQSLLCLRPRRQKKKVTYSSYMQKLLNQTWSTRVSCLAAAVLAWLDSSGMLGNVALEAARLSCCSRRSRLGPRELLLAMELVLLRELCKQPPGSSEPPPKGPSDTGQS
ncbi:histone H2B-like [Heliangelus exortis]|uniref:histone H2B-like n=1 Tax=Heliangelus exortis TaxID=472823 RepID=UPI003A9213B7